MQPFLGSCGREKDEHQRERMGHLIDVVSKEERNVCTHQNQKAEIWSCKKKQMDHIRKRFTSGELCSSREKYDKGDNERKLSAEWDDAWDKIFIVR